MMQLLLLLTASAAARIFQLSGSVGTAAAGGRSDCVFWPWAGGSCGFCSCRARRVVAATTVGASAAPAAVDGLCGLRLAASEATAAAGGRCSYVCRFCGRSSCDR